MATGQYPRRLSGAFLLLTDEHCKLSQFGHVCHHDTLLSIILQGTVDARRHRGRPRRSWKDNIKEWTGQSLLHIADDRSQWAFVTAEVSVEYPNDAWASLVLVRLSSTAT